MAKAYTKEEKAAKLKLIADLRREGTPLLQALKQAGVPVGTHYTWSKGQKPAKAKTKKQRMPATPQLVQIPQAVEPEKIIMLLGTPRNIAAMLERFL